MEIMHAEIEVIFHGLLGNFMYIQGSIAVGLLRTSPGVTVMQAANCQRYSLESFSFPHD